MSDIEDDIEIQFDIAQRISSLYENLKKEPTANRTRGFLLSKRKSVEELWVDFKANHDNIFRGITKADGAKNHYLASQTFNDAYKIRETMLIKIEEWLQLITPEAATLANIIQIADQHQAPPAAVRQRLPAIKIEPFSGDYTKRMAFKSIFTSLIHSRADVPPIEKFHYLLSFLTGEAARVINHYALTEQWWTVF